MGRMSRIVNFTCTTKDTWYEVFDESDYKSKRIKEIKVKLREMSTADHFRYAYKPDSIVAGVITIATYMTSTAGFVVVKDIKKLYVYVPDNDSEIIEIEIIYR